MKASFVTLALALAGAAAVAGAALAQAKPDKPVDILVGASPGGGFDRMARSIEAIVQQKRMLDVPLNIRYHPGAGGAVAWSILNRTPGDMTKLSIFSPNLVTNEAQGTSESGFRDFTVLATLVFEDGCFALNPNGRMRTADDLVNALRTDASSVRFSFAISAGNQWHVAMAKLTEAVGADITKVRATVFDSAGKAVAALLGGHADVSVSGCASFAEYHASKQLNVVAVSAPERVGGVLADVPTWAEQGLDVNWSAWRGVLAPKGLSPEAVAYWERFFEAVVSDPGWKEIEAENYWRTRFAGSAKTAEMLAFELEQYTKAMKQLGLIP